MEGSSYPKQNYSKCMKEIQEKSTLVHISARFELAGVGVTGSQLFKSSVFPVFADFTAKTLVCMTFPITKNHKLPSSRTRVSCLVLYETFQSIHVHALNPFFFEVGLGGGGVINILTHKGSVH